MGNLGRAGYGSTTDGTWPYSVNFLVLIGVERTLTRTQYDSCDWGTLPNQTFNGMPAAALSGGDPSVGGALSFLPGEWHLSFCYKYLGSC
jgi:hypothetical protein